MSLSQKHLPIYLKVKLGVMLLLPSILLLLPADFFDEGESVCVSVLVFDLECYACGMTRAVMHLIHFNFSKAWEYNLLSYPVVAIGGFLYAKETWNTFLRLKKKNDHQP
ncbi:MAG: DUF2752 domain-containing protein [Cyclobacteriaceae bacterium]|nr:DUF2752 domain-containing protein [Cyclobacteriaceae bacterium]MCH8516770.1 DUF2752 domain-containing protein [Cyclobacteriaceae bacterium]